MGNRKQNKKHHPRHKSVRIELHPKCVFLKSGSIVTLLGPATTELNGNKIYGYTVARQDGTTFFAPEGSLRKVDTMHELLQFFQYGHLPEQLQTVSRPFGELALQLNGLPDNVEKDAALRKLLEAKDCAVRAVLHKQEGIGD